MYIVHANPANLVPYETVILQDVSQNSLSQTAPILEDKTQDYGQAQEIHVHQEDVINMKHRHFHRITSINKEHFT